MLALLMPLLLAHVLGDFVLQPTKWVTQKEAKKHKSLYLYLHIAIHAVCTTGLLLISNRSFWTIIPIVLPLLLSHYITDLTKINLKGKLNATLLFFGDQALHLAVIFALAILGSGTSISLVSEVSTNHLTFMTLILFATLVSSVMMRVLLQNWDSEIDLENETKSLKSAGKYIGILERLLVFIFVILNQWSAIGFLIAAKSAFRFGDLSDAKNRKLTEYMLIGTLLSFGLAIFFGILYTHLTKQI